MSGFFDRNGLADYDAAGADERMAAGGRVPEGFHAATLVGAAPKTANSGSTGTLLTFEIAAGDAKGQTIEDTLWEGEKPKLKDRIAVFATRLGLATKVGGKLVLCAGRQDFTDCLGEACVIEVQHEDWKNDATGKSGTVARLTFNGVRRVDDPEAVKALAHGGVTPGKPAKGADDKPAGKKPPAAVKKNYLDDL